MLNNDQYRLYFLNYFIFKYSDSKIYLLLPTHSNLATCPYLKLTISIVINTVSGWRATTPISSNKKKKYSCMFLLQKVQITTQFNFKPRRLPSTHVGSEDVPPFNPRLSIRTPRAISVFTFNRINFFYHIIVGGLKAPL